MTLPPHTSMTPRRPRWWPPKLAIPLIALVLLVAVGGFVGGTAPRANALSLRTAGWSTSVSSSSTTVAQGTSVRVTVTVTPTTTRSENVDLEIYAGTARSFQQVWRNQAFVAGTSRTFSVTWKVASTQPLGWSTLKVGLFSPTWSLHYWDDRAARLQIVSPTGTTVPTTTVPATTMPPMTTVPATTMPPMTTTATTTPATTAPATTVPATTMPSMTTTTTGTQPPLVLPTGIAGSDPVLIRPSAQQGRRVM